MLKHRLLSSAIVLAGGLFMGNALANTDETGMHSGEKSKDLSFEKVDQDGDGYISQSEFENINVEQQLDHGSLDQDQDGRLDRTEFAAFERLSQDPSEQATEYPSQTTGETYESTTQDPAQDPASDWPSESEPESDY